MEFFDSHAHLDDEKFDKDRESIIEEIKKDGITRFVSAGYSLEGTQKGIELSEKYDFIYTTCAISPNDIPQTETEMWKSIDKIKELSEKHIKNKKIVAIGEIGLDYHYGKEDRDKQIDLFIKQLDIARKYNLPVIIHSRDAINDTINILKNYKDLKKVLHCYSGSIESARELIKLDTYFGVGGVLTFKNSTNLVQTIKKNSTR